MKTKYDITQCVVVKLRETPYFGVVSVSKDLGKMDFSSIRVYQTKDLIKDKLYLHTYTEEFLDKNIIFDFGIQKEDITIEELKEKYPEAFI